jgi:3-hydroxyisobutyrate dehydrogenase
MTLKVSFIGLGSMGGDQARQIAKGSLALTVYDVFPPALDKFRGLATLAGSPADAARSADIVAICVRDDDQVMDTLFGTQGVTETLPRGALVIVHSTIRLDTVAKLQRRLAERGLRFMDAPVTRTRIGEDGRFVFTMTGGDPADSEYARPLLDTFSTDVLHIGPCGSAMALKIANNLVTWTQLMVGCQAAKLATHYGVSFEALAKVMKSNGNLTPPMEAVLKAQHAIPPGSNPDYDALMASQAGIGEKDLALAAECGQLAGLDMNMALEARKLVRPTFERS